jgi:hypothetical protein
MTAATLEKTAFSAGELDPALHARRDLGRHQTGLAKCENFVVMVEGGVTRRPGTRFVVPLRNEAQHGLLLPFEFTIDDAYQLLFNDGYMRVLRNGGVVEAPLGGIYELATAAFTEAVLEKMRWAQSGDVIFIAWGGRPKVLTRFDHNNWTLTDYVNLRGPVEPQNTDTAKTLSASAATGTGVTLTANFNAFDIKHVGSTWRLDEANLANVARWKGNETGLSAGQLRRNAGSVYSVVSGTDAGPNPPQHDEGVVLSGNGNVAWQFEHAGSGYFKVTAYVSPTQVTGDVIGKLPSDVVGSNATYRWYEPAWSDLRGWPTQVLLDDNALFWFRGNKHWRSKANDFYDFDVTAEDDSAIAGLLTAPNGQLVDIQWALNAGVVVLGTRSSEWTLRAGGDPFAPMTITNVRALPGTTEGSAPHRPQAVDGGAVFIGRSRRRLHFAQFDVLGEKVSTDELTLYARNILKGAATDIAYQRDPYRVIWVAQATGELVAITFRPDQEVIGWHRHPMTNGFVEDVSVITSADGASSELWLIVRRTIDGQTRRYVEVMQPYFQPLSIDAPTAEGAWFVDSGLRYQGAAAKTISGLDHLKGQTVNIIANAIEHRSLVVSADGSVTLDRNTTDCVIGLPIRGRVKTLKMDIDLNGGSTKGRAKNADAVYVEQLYAAGGEIMVNGEDFSEELLLTGAEAPPSARPLESGGVMIPLLSDIQDYLEVELITAGVYPFTLTGLTPSAQFTESG